MVMPRFALKIEYDGAPFSGWQRQDTHPSVQGAIETAMAKLEANVPSLAAAGRTDAGVHGLGQIAHVDLKKDWSAYRLSEALNFHLKPAPVAIVAASAVPDTFHARFSAVRRRYLFRIRQRRAPLVHDRGFVWRLNHQLDVPAMQDAAQHLIGLHDFTTFRSTMCQSKSPVKTLDQLDIETVGDEVHFHVEARSFLHNQVRSFVGTLERVGAGAWTPDRVKTALQAANRAECGPVSPPDGLYLAEVGYETDPFA